jgi:Ca-activated chloride channel family protein
MQNRWPMAVTGVAGASIAVVAALLLLGIAGCESEQATSTAAGQGRTRLATGAMPEPAKPEPPAATTAPPPKSAEPAQAAPHGVGAMQLQARRDAQPSTTLTVPAPIAPPGPTAQFANAEANGVVAVKEQPVSTFSLDVDTASYAVSRRFLKDGKRPPRQAVRVEQFVNYFPYEYAPPASRDAPFSLDAAIVPAPWRKDAQLLHIALKAYEIPLNARPPANLVLLIDVSGSMSPSDRLPLLKQVFRSLARELRPIDRVAIVSYANGVAVRLEPTTGDKRDTILAAIDALNAGGGTAGSDGIQRAYALAEQHFDPKAVNRVLLATDGDFNVGITDPNTLRDFVAERRKQGIYLSVFGVGLGNLNDRLMQMLAHAGNGNAAYIDSALEARKALGAELGATVFPVADDAKIQVEFNPARVAEYRLIGYETRMLKREDFKDDRVDAGDIGSGHSVTAIYEIVAPDSPARLIEPLRYGGEARPARSDEIAHIRLRYKLPGAGESQLMERPVMPRDVAPRLDQAAPHIRFSIAVAAFGQLLRGEPRVDGYGYADVLALAEPARGRDPMGYRAEFLQLVRMAGGLTD